MAVFSKKIGAVLTIIGFVMLFCLSCFCSTASAESGGTIKLVCEVSGKPVTGMKWEAYRIGTFDGQKITLDREYAKYPVDMTDLSASGFADAASTLKDFVFTYGNNHTPSGRGISQNDGIITFSNLKDGLYLIVARNYMVGVTTYIPTPAIVNLDSQLTPELTINAKIKPIATLSDTVEKFSVKKIWENADNLPLKPTEIIIDVYKNYQFFETVSLTEANNWYYEWHDEVDVEWSVIERKIPKDCCVVYRNDGRNYVVVNTYVPDFEFDWEANFPPPETTPTTTNTATATTTTKVSFPLVNESDTRNTETSTTTVSTTVVANKTTDKTPIKTTTTTKKLPQTGQLWWPVPVLAIGGLALIAVGSKIISGSKRDEDE